MVGGHKRHLARAKVNLTLHVGALRDDGYHPLESLVVFADIGDSLSFEPADETTLKIAGADELPTDGNNLIIRAMQMVKADPHHIHLIKNLNPGVAVSTGAIFRAMDAQPRETYPKETALKGDLLSRALSGRNDMQEVATLRNLFWDFPLRCASSTGRACHLSGTARLVGACVPPWRSTGRGAARSLRGRRPMIAQNVIFWLQIGV